MLHRDDCRGLDACQHALNLGGLGLLEKGGGEQFGKKARYDRGTGGQSLGDPVRKTLKKPWEKGQVN